MGSLDRESRQETFAFTGTGGESAAISTARYAWQSIHLPKNGFSAGNLTYEIFNDASGEFVPAKDNTGVAIAAVPVTAGDVIPVNSFVNYARLYRIKISSAQTAGVEFVVINKT